jgi:hypothetical protein
MSWYTSGQNDGNIRWFLLDSTHGSYETRRAAIQSLSPNYTIDNGIVANTKVVRGYLTAAEITTNSLGIGGAVLDMMDYTPCINPNAAAVTIRTNAWGDKYPVWGEFLQQPQALPTTNVDRVVQWWKDGIEDVLYVAQEDRGTGDGSSYANRVAIHDICDATASQAVINPTNYDIIVICGRVSRHINQGGQSSSTDGATFEQKTGTSGTRTVIMSHPTDRGEIMGGSKLGSGASGDGVWVNDSGNRWKSVNTSGSGGGVPVYDLHFVHADDGGTGTLRVLTKVASAALCASTTDSYFIDVASGVLTNVYVNIGGADPTHRTYWGGAAWGGLTPKPSSPYTDWVGLKFYNVQWSFPATTNGHNFRSINCFHGWLVNYLITPVCGIVTTGTGALSSLTALTDYQFLGCEFAYAQAGHYGLSGASDVTPNGLVIQDTYIHHIGSEASAETGQLTLAVTGDSHAIAVEGAIFDVTLDNIRIKNCGPQTVVFYIEPHPHTIPSGGLELTDGYVYGWKRANCYPLTSDPTKEIWQAPCHDVYGTDILITDTLPRTGSYTGVDGMGLSLNGNQPYGYNDRIEVLFENCRVESASYSDGAIRIKHSLDVTGHADADVERIQFRYITIRGAEIAVRLFDNPAEDQAGANVSSCGYIHHCDIHATSLFVQSQQRNTRWARKFDYNTYRNDAGAYWTVAGEADALTLAQWTARANATFEVHDPNGSHTALTADTSTPALTATGGPTIGSTLTATLGADADGATSSLSYQWFRNGDLITSATASTYAATAGNGNTAGDDIACVVLGKDAKDKWFLVTSNEITLTAAAGATDSGDAQVYVGGTPIVGNALTADFANDDPDGIASAIAYQWQTTGAANIGGATLPTLPVTSAYLGLTIRVQVTYTDAEGFEETIYSDYTAAVTAAPISGSGGIPISEGEYHRRKKKAFLTRAWDWIKRQFQ